VLEITKKKRPVGPIPFPPPKNYKYGKNIDGEYQWVRQPIKYGKMKDLWSMRCYSTGNLTKEELNYWYPYPSEISEEQTVYIEDEDLELEKLYDYLYKRVVANEFEAEHLKDAIEELYLQ
jgi:hypothetical protein